ncbi:hypothetical protein JW905_14895, partial [bacterium]|nr:hypothetical protein [candidate division CSSED10-310 bacterium]
LLTPYGCQAMTPPDHAPLNDIAAATAAVVVGDDGSSAYGTDPWWVVMLPGDGRTSDWLYGVGGALSYDILLNASTYQPSYASLRNLTVQRQRPGWQELLDLPVETRLLHGHFIDACTQQPIPGAHYSLEERPLENGEPMRVANATFGSYFLHMQTNTYHVLAQQNGYGAMRHEIYMRNGPVAMDLPLVPSNQRGLGFLTLSVDDVSGDHDYIWDPGEEVALMVNLHAPGLAVTGISGTLATNDSYVTISDGQAEFDDAPAGGTSWSTAPHFIAFSDPSTPENHRVEFILDLSADQSLCLSESMFQVRVKSTMELCPYVEFNLNANPNWTIVNSDNNGWEYGAPVSGPSSAHTGLNVYGTNLDGFYSNNCDYKLTTTPIDCSTLADTTLRFWRFLNCEEDYDDAYVSISTNGTTWTDVFHGETQDNNWVERSYDIAAYADGEPAVYVRFQLTSNASLVMTGFYVDDVVICGTYLGPPPATYVPTPTPFSTFTPTPSPTPTSTAVVTGTPGSSPTPTAVFTTPPGTITPAATATPVPGEFTLNLSINDIVFEAGDVFLLQCEMRNEGPTIMVDLLVVLDYFGSYWFYPDWTTDADWVTHQMGQGTHYTEEVLNFVWPGDVGEEYGVLFWAGCVASGTTDVVGDIRYVSFGWR